MSFNNRGTISIMLVVGVFVAGFVCWLQFAAAKPDAKRDYLEPIPTVYALVRLAKEEPLWPDPKQARKRSDKADKLMKRTEITLVKSRDVLLAALRKDQVRRLPIIQKQRNPTEWLEKSLEVIFLNETDILRIGMSGSNPEEMVVLINAILDAYAHNRRNHAHKQAADRFGTLEKVYVQTEEKLRTQMMDLRKLAEIHKTPSPLDQQILVQSLQDCSRELRRVRLEGVAVQVKLARKPVEKEEGKESKTGSKQVLEEKMAILAEQEKLLAEEVKDLRGKTLGLGSFEIEIRQQEVDAGRQILRRLREEKERLEVEKLNDREKIEILQRAEVPNPK